MGTTTHTERPKMGKTLSADEYRERFNRRVEKGPSCWEWAGSRNRAGYGKFRFLGSETAHRAAYLLFVGPIPDGMHVCHACDNPPCVNPAHLFLGTANDNAADKHAKGREARGERMNLGGLTDASVAWLRSEYRRGERGVKVLAREVGVRPSTALRAIRGATWTHVAEPPVLETMGASGAANRARTSLVTRAKLTADQVQAIRAAAAAGRAHRRIAPEFGISASQVDRIVRKQQWPHV